MSDRIGFFWPVGLTYANLTFKTYSVRFSKNTEQMEDYEDSSYFWWCPLVSPLPSSCFPSRCCAVTRAGPSSPHQAPGRPRHSLKVPPQIMFYTICNILHNTSVQSYHTHTPISHLQSGLPNVSLKMYTPWRDLRTSVALLFNSHFHRSLPTLRVRPSPIIQSRLLSITKNN